MNFQEIAPVSFPTATDLCVNMMPFIFGDKESLPKNLHSYLPLIEAANLMKGSTAYLTIHESYVEAGTSQRRPGIHTDGTKASPWGGGGWGGLSREKGIYLASTDGRCKVWDTQAFNVDNHGGVLDTLDEGIELHGNKMYWITDRTPHEALPSVESGYRQFYRLVADEVGVWWDKHSTKNPLGVQPNCKVITESKF